MRPPCASCCDACSLCAVFFFYDRPVVVVLWALGRHTHIAASQSTPHAHIVHRAPLSSINSHRGRGEGRQRHAVEGWQGADATSMTPPCALSTTAAHHADAGALYAVLFLLQTRPVSENLCFGRWSDTRTSHSTPHAQTARRPPMASIDSLRVTAVQNRSPTSCSSRAAAAALVARA